MITLRATKNIKKGEWLASIFKDGKIAFNEEEGVELEQ